jgi:hypothetical protein
MIVKHLAATLLFSGPLFYAGLLMTVDPAGCARLPGLLIRLLRNGRFSGPEHADIPRRLQTALRFAGIALLLFAVAA